MQRKKIALFAVAALILLALVGIVTACDCGDDCCCWFTGGGTIMTIDGRQSFGGNAMTMKNKPVQGEWEYVNHATGDIFHGKVTYLKCWKTEEPGPSPPKAVPNYIEFGGEGVLNHVGGYSFEVKAYDSGEPATRNAPGDRYWIKIWDSCVGSPLVEEYGALSGNFQIHPPNNGHPCEV